MDFTFKDESEDLSTGGGDFIRQAGLYPCTVERAVFVESVQGAFASSSFFVFELVCTDGRRVEARLEVGRDGSAKCLTRDGRSYILAGYKQLGQITKLSGVAPFSVDGSPTASTRVLGAGGFFEAEGKSWEHIAGAKLYFLFDLDKNGYLLLQKVFSYKGLDIDGVSVANAPFYERDKNKSFKFSPSARLKKYLDSGSEGANPDFDKPYTGKDDSEDFRFKDEPKDEGEPEELPF